jgi:hypothetical protein
MTQRGRVLVAAAAALAFCVPILATLLATVYGSTQTALNPIASGEPGVSLEVRGHSHVETDGTFFIHQVTLRTQHPERLLAHQQIGLSVATFATRPDLQDGELRFPKDGCVYRTKRGAQVLDNQLLFFLRRGDCAVPSAASHDILLRLRFRNPSRIAIWTWQRPPGFASDDAVFISSFRAADPAATYLPSGVVVDRHPDVTARRVDLLAYVWDISPSSAWIFAALTAAGLLLGAAVMLGWRPVERRSWRLPAAAFCAAAAFSGMYAVVVPPFQSADEPNHFTALADYYARPELGSESMMLARRGHFEEIQFHRCWKPSTSCGP